MRLARFATASAAVLLLAAPLAEPAQAQQATVKPHGGKHGAARPEEQPALVTADQITHDRDLNTVTATGHVEVDQGGRILLADTLSYNLKQDVIVATGNVSLTDIDGQVNFADYMELTGDLKNAAAQGIRVLMVDDSRIAANSGRRISGENGEEKTVFEQGVYSACKPCREHPEKAPLWDLRARRVTHDQVEHVIQYDDAWLSLDGIPVAYTPYFSHADPTLKRKSGLLPPSVLSSDAVGYGVRFPYFQVIDTNQDLTLTPLVTQKYGGMIDVIHRLRTTDGEMKTNASFADQQATTGGSGTSYPALKGWHVDAYSRFDIDETWRVGYQIQRAVNQTYLQTYGFHTDRPYLTTRPYAEGFGEKDYASVEAYSFQSLTTPSLPAGASQPLKSPQVFPLANYHYVGDPHDGLGDYWTFDGHTAAISRSEGPSSRRVNSLTAWHMPYGTDDGQLYHFTGSMRADAYNSDHITPGQPGLVNAYRAMPTASVDWRYPFLKTGEHSSQVISPIVVASLAPYAGNSNKIPNEDSLDFELDDTNVFSSSPFTGYDRVLGGPHVSYGLEYSVANRGTQSVDAAIGQMYQVRPQQVFVAGTGLDHNFSDYVGRFSFSPSGPVNVAYRYRLDRGNFTLRRSEINASVGPSPFNINSSYVFFDRLNPASPYPSREQLTTTITAKLSQYWTTAIYQTENLGINAGPYNEGFRVTYEDECLLITADAGSTHTTSTVFSSGHHLMFRVVFKSLGEFPVNVF